MNENDEETSSATQSLLEAGCDNEMDAGLWPRRYFHVAGDPIHHDHRGRDPGFPACISLSVTIRGECSKSKDG